MDGRCWIRGVIQMQTHFAQPHLFGERKFTQLLAAQCGDRLELFAINFISGDSRLLGSNRTGIQRDGDRARGIPELGVELGTGSGFVATTPKGSDPWACVDCAACVLTYPASFGPGQVVGSAGRLALERKDNNW